MVICPLVICIHTPTRHGSQLHAQPFRVLPYRLQQGHGSLISGVFLSGFQSNSEVPSSLLSCLVANTESKYKCGYYLNDCKYICHLFSLPTHSLKSAVFEDLSGCMLPRSCRINFCPCDYSEINQCIVCHLTKVYCVCSIEMITVKQCCATHVDTCHVRVFFRYSQRC